MGFTCTHVRNQTCPIKVDRTTQYQVNNLCLFLIFSTLVPYSSHIVVVCKQPSLCKLDTMTCITKVSESEHSILLVISEDKHGFQKFQEIHSLQAMIYLQLSVGQVWTPFPEAVVWSGEKWVPEPVSTQSWMKRHTQYCWKHTTGILIWLRWNNTNSKSHTPFI